MNDGMDDRNVTIIRQPGDWKAGVVKAKSITDPHWDNVSGGVKKVTKQYYLYGYVYCNEIIEGEVSHSCNHGDAPHNIKVYIRKNGNDKDVYEFLAEKAGTKPIVRIRAVGQRPCTKGILEILTENGKMKRKDLRNHLISSGYQGTTIRNALKTMQNDKRLSMEGYGVNQLICINKQSQE